MKENRTVLVQMKDGNEYVGVFLKKNKNNLVLKTKNGVFNLIASDVVSIKNYDYLGKFQFPNPNDTRYFFGPSAIPIEKGGGYYQNLLLTTNFVNYGITKNISIGGGFEFISTLVGNPIWFFTPKMGVTISDNFHVGGGVLMAGFASEGTATLSYGVFTYGNSETNISLGAGYGLMGGSFSAAPSIMISATHRVSNSIALLTENYILSNGFYFGIHGIRILSKKNAFDIGAILLQESLPPLPYVGYVRVF